MKAGDIVKVKGHSRVWVALNVTRRQIRRGLNTRTAGMHLFGGAWYGNDLMNERTYGKILRANVPHKIVGHVKSSRTLRNDLRLARTNKPESKTLAMMRLREEFRELRK